MLVVREGVVVMMCNLISIGVATTAATIDLVFVLDRDYADLSYQTSCIPFSSLALYLRGFLLLILCYAFCGSLGIILGYLFGIKI